jgi:hypothetical protein
MKFAKTVLLASTALGVLIALNLAGTASATVLCTTTSTPCANRWGANTVIDSSLEAGKSSEIKDTFGFQLEKCNTSTLKLTTTTVGSATTTVLASFAKGSLTWEACNEGTTTLIGGSVEIHHIAGTDNGTITVKELRITINSVLGDCIYGFGKNFADVGTFTGGSIPAGTPPVIDINAVLASEGGACPVSARWTATFEVTSPNGFGMYVEPS